MTKELHETLSVIVGATSEARNAKTGTKVLTLPSVAYVEFTSGGKISVLSFGADPIVTRKAFVFYLIYLVPGSHVGGSVEGSKRGRGIANDRAIHGSGGAKSS